MSEMVATGAIPAEDKAELKKQLYRTQRRRKFAAVGLVAAIALTFSEPEGGLVLVGWLAASSASVALLGYVVNLLFNIARATAER